MGDCVILKQRKKDKFTTRFESTPYTVTERKGTKIIAENQRHQVTRNASFFKKLKEVERESDGAEDNIHGNIEPGEREKVKKCGNQYQEDQQGYVCKQNTMGTQ